MYFFALFLDVELMGTWALMNSIIDLSFLFFNIGIESIHYQYSGKKNFDEYFGTFILIKGLLLLLNIGSSFILIFVFELWNSVYFSLILFVLFSKIIIGVINIFVIQLRAKIKVFLIEIPLFFISLGQNIGKIYVALNISSIIDPLFTLSVINFTFNSVHIIIILLLSKNNFKITKPKKSIAISYIKDTKPLILFSILSVIGNNIGYIILDPAFEHESLAYFYLVNTYIIPILTLISTSIIALYMPIFSQHYEKNEMSSIQETIRIIEKYLSIFFLSIIIFVFLNGELIFSILLPNYLNALPILYIMIFIPYLSAISRPYGVLLISGKKQELSASLSIFNVVIKLILIFILIPREFLIFKMLGLGTIGYALALLAPNIISSFLFRYFSKKKFDIKYQKQLLLHFFTAFFSVLITFLLKIYFIDLIIENQLLVVVILTLTSLGIFFGVLFIFNQLKKEDISFFLQLLRIKRYIELMKEEFSKS